MKSRTEHDKIYREKNKDKIKAYRDRKCYYKNNKSHYAKGGKYYYYKPKHNPPFVVTINRGEFIITFD